MSSNGHLLSDQCEHALSAEFMLGVSPQPSEAAEVVLRSSGIKAKGAGRDLYGLKKDGSEFPVEIGLNPIETDEGTMVLSAIVDISPASDWRSASAWWWSRRQTRL